MTTIAKEGTYELWQRGERVGYFVAAGPQQHWVLYENYVPPSRVNRRTELELRRAAEPLPADPPALFARAGRPGAQYIYGAPVGVAKQIDVGCFQVSQEGQLVGQVCVASVDMAMIERWELAREPTDQLRPFRLIGETETTTLTFEWFDERRKGVDRPLAGSGLARKWLGADEGPWSEASARLLDEGESTLRLSVACHDRSADVGG